MSSLDVMRSYSWWAPHVQASGVASWADLPEITVQSVEQLNLQDLLPAPLAGQILALLIIPTVSISPELITFMHVLYLSDHGLVSRAC